MAGVIRPYTLVDVLSTINQNLNSNATTGANAVSFGVIAEVSDALTAVGDTATAAASTVTTWDSGSWGAVGWQ